MAEFSENRHISNLINMSCKVRASKNVSFTPNSNAEVLGLLNSRTWNTSELPLITMNLAKLFYLRHSDALPCSVNTVSHANQLHSQRQTSFTVIQFNSRRVGVGIYYSQ